MRILFAALISIPLIVNVANAQEANASDILFLKIQELEGELASLRSELESQGYLIEKLLSICWNLFILYKYYSFLYLYFFEISVVKYFPWDGAVLNAV